MADTTVLLLWIDWVEFHVLSAMRDAHVKDVEKAVCSSLPVHDVVH